jgi:methylglutaconyl-CoA hydratase
MDSLSTLRLDRRDDAVAVVTLDRPDRHNAFNDTMIAELTDALRRLGADPAVRAVVLRGQGKNFSAGADLQWMQKASRQAHGENVADADALAQLMLVLDTLPKPTVAVVHGAVVGGGIGLVACCDVAVASDLATFALSEVRLGILPAVISPYVVAAIGPRWARRWMLTAERFDAAEALHCGLVHRVVPPAELDEAVEDVLGRLLEGAPGAQAATKELVRTVGGHAVDVGLIAETARRIADARASAEGREGIAAFLDKRLPAWRQ